MAESCGEIVEVVIQTLMPSHIGREDAGNGVQLTEQRLSGSEVSCPVWVGAADAVGGEERGSGRAGVSRFEAVDRGGLDGEWEGTGGMVHGGNEHAGYLAGNDVISDAVGDF